MNTDVTENNVSKADRLTCVVNGTNFVPNRLFSTCKSYIFHTGHSVSLFNHSLHMQGKSE